MKKMDEMDRKIQLHAEEISYRSTLLILSIWTLYNCWQTLVNGEKYNVFPGLIVCLAVSVQNVAQLVIKRKMIDGDEEYREPNKLILAILGCLAVVAIVLFVGTTFIVGA